MIRVKSIVLVGGFDDMRRGAPKIIKDRMYDMAKMWHRRFLPMHFRQGAAARYGYKERTGKYKWEKRRKKGHAKPLVYTGTTKAQVGAFIRVTGSSKRVRASMSAPWYVAMVPKRRNAPVLGREIASITDAEVQWLTSRLEKSVAYRLERLPTRKVVRIGG